MLLAYSRWNRTTRQSAAWTGANRTWRPESVTSRMPPPGTGPEQGHQQQRLATSSAARRSGRQLLAEQVDVLVARTSASRLYISSRSRCAWGSTRAEVDVDRQLDAYLAKVGLPLPLALELLNSLADQPDVEVEPDVRDMTGLLAPAGCQRRGSRGPRRRSPCHRRGRSAGPAWPAARARSRSAASPAGTGSRRRPARGIGSPTAQLVELGEAQGVGPLDDHGVRVGDVEARFDDRRAHQHVEGLSPEVQASRCSSWCSPICRARPRREPPTSSRIRPRPLDALHPV